MTTPDWLAAIEARLKAATPGPWTECGASDGKCSCGLVWQREIDCLVHGMPDPNDVPISARARADSTFIAHARTDAELLLAEVKRLGQMNDNQASMIQAARDENRELARTIERDDLGTVTECVAEIDQLRAEVKRLGVELDGSFGGVSRNRVFEIGKEVAADEVKRLRGENAVVQAKARCWDASERYREATKERAPESEWLKALADLQRARIALHDAEHPARE